MTKTMSIRRSTANNEKQQTQDGKLKSYTASINEGFNLFWQIC